MDANGQRFWMLAETAHWRVGEGEGIEFDAARRRLRLRSEARGLPMLAATDGEAELLRVPQARDAFGTRAFWDPATRTIRADGAFDDIEAVHFKPPRPVALHQLAATETVTDLALGHDGVLYVALADEAGNPPPRAVLLLDRRDRWQPVRVAQAGFAPWRLAAHPAGGMWLLDADRRRIGRLQGLPLPEGLPKEKAETVFGPVEENPDRPRIELIESPAFAGDEKAAALTCCADGRLAVLAWSETKGARLHLRGTGGRWEAPRTLLKDWPRKARTAPAVEIEAERSTLKAWRPFGLAWLPGGRFAVIPAGLPAGKEEAFVFPLGRPGDELSPIGEVHPLRGHDGGPFAHGVSPPVHYPVTDGDGLRPLLPLSRPSYATQGRTTGLSLDSCTSGTTWHRLFLETVMPPDAGALVELAAGDDPDEVPAPKEWHPHHFGETDVTVSDGPRGVWRREPSELPHHPGLLGCRSERDRAGLFGVLIQRAGRRVRALRGRFLHVRVTLTGNGRSTPELAALRAHASRFSYRDRYLPELYRETEFGADADRAGSATRADFLDRFLGLFEGELTPLEDRVADAHVLLDPRSAPDDALEWIGTWIGVPFDPAFPSAQRRQWLRAAHRLFRQRGTTTGLQLALELATGGSMERRFVDGREREVITGGHVTGGEIVVVEDFRLRRTFATILGADLSEPDDPLLPGLIVSGNSFVGDTLLVGEEQRKEFLALFQNGFSTSSRERQREELAATALFERFAHRVTVLVHQEVEPQDLGLIRRVVAQETPAHVSARVAKASHPLIVALASVLDVDTYLVPRPARRRARVGEDSLGTNGFISQPASLDPRLEGGRRAAV